jgi:hypothetical protein
VSLGVFTFVISIQNWQLISSLWFSDIGTLSQKLILTLTLYTSIGTNFTFLSATTTVLTSILFGVNIALLVYYIKKVQGGAKTAFSGGATSMGGLLSGLLGIGCAACGTFIATSILALFGVGALLGLLPLGGEEFGIVAVLLLGYSIYRIGKKINSPLVCEVT